MTGMVILAFFCHYPGAAEVLYGFFQVNQYYCKVKKSLINEEAYKL